MKQLLVFKFEGMALLTRLIMLILASPVLWFVDIMNFSIDLAKSMNKKKLVFKTIVLVAVILVIIQLIENACGELNELYFELLKITWLSLKIMETSTVYVNTSVLSILLMFLIMMFPIIQLLKQQALKISSGDNYYLPDEIFSCKQSLISLLPHQSKNDSTFFMASGIAKTTT